MSVTRWRVTFSGIEVSDHEKLIDCANAHLESQGYTHRAETVQEALEAVIDCMIERPIDHGFMMGVYEAEQVE